MNYKLIDSKDSVLFLNPDYIQDVALINLNSEMRITFMNKEFLYIKLSEPISEKVKEIIKTHDFLEVSTSENAVETVYRYVNTQHITLLSIFENTLYMDNKAKISDLKYVNSVISKLQKKYNFDLIKGSVTTIDQDDHQEYMIVVDKIKEVKDIPLPSNRNLREICFHSGFAINADQSCENLTGQINDINKSKVLMKHL